MEKAGRLAGLLACLLLPAPAARAAVTPTLTVVSSVACGNVTPGSTTGTLVLAPTQTPSGVRSATGGCALAGSASFNLGAFTIAGTSGDTFTVQEASATTLTNGSKSMTVSSPTFSVASGTFPYAGTLYFGLTVAVNTAANNPAGTYTGTLKLTVKDTKANKTSTQVSFTVQVVVPASPTGLGLSTTTHLSFGTVVENGASGGTVVMDTAGTRTPSSGVLVLASAPGTAASFQVQGTTSALYAITLPASISLTGPAGSTPMTVNAFTSSPSGSGILSTANPGAQTLAVGATLNVGASQMAGSYSGTFTVTVAYE